MKILFPIVYLAAPIYGAAIRGQTHPSTPVVTKMTCHGIDYEYNELAGYGYVVSDARDKFGDTLGGLGSGIHLDRAAWKKLDNGSYTGVLWSLPDRGWNTEGTLNFHARVHKFTVNFTPEPDATAENPSAPNLFLQYEDTILFSGPDGSPISGLDADATGHISFSGFPDLPVSNYTGDGFGGAGPGGKRVTIDAEGLYVNDDSSFWVSDEYGPYVYLFSPDGKMLSAIRPPDALVPVRNGVTSFSSDSPPVYIHDGQDDDVDPADPESGRDNNHGFEGLSVSDDGKSLWVLLQVAAVQEGGLEAPTARHVRFLKYDISNRLAPEYAGEWVLPLPFYTPENSNIAMATAMTDILALENGQFFLLSQAPNAGHGGATSFSPYRQVDVFDISSATDIRGPVYDCSNCNVANAESGELKEDITPASLCSFLDVNDNAQLNRFGMHNGGDQDQFLLNMKWESLGIVPVDPNTPNGEYYLFSLSDNDFITQDGYMNGGKYHYVDSTGYNLDSQALVFKISISS
ncbi:esterase-like activity of phytase-domain-containing protein [Hypoxylon cercidicola]|nr:esterase-like activity of phytase-domain-containing protein [Hypoxylon cercidicola]